MITILVQVPDLRDRFPLLMGQTLELQLDLTSTVAHLKNELQTRLGVMAGKQRLRTTSSTLFLKKDTSTLAYYNLVDHSVLQLGLRERGGRK
jgi:hypothetical protein